MTDLLSRLVFDVDKQGQQKINKAVDETKKKISQLSGKELEELGKRAVVAAKEIGNSELVLNNVVQSMRELGASDRQVDKVTRAFKRQEAQLEQNARRQKELANSQDVFDATSRNVALAGDVQSNLGALNALSGGGLGTAGEVVALVEELPRLKTALAGLPQTLSSAAAAIGPAGFAVGAALAVAGVALADFVQKAQREADLLRAEYDQRVDLETRLEQGRVSFEGLTNEIADLEAELRAAQNTTAEFSQDAQDSFDELVEFGEGLGFGPLADANARLSVFIQELTGVKLEAGVASEAAKEQSDRVAELSRRLEVYNGYLDDSRLATQDAAEREAELQKAREEQARLAEQLAQTEEQSVQARERYTRESVRINEDRNIAATREEEDFNERIADIRAAGVKRIEAIEKQGQQRIAKIRSQLSDLPRQLTEDLADAERKAAEERQDILTDYTTDANRAWEDFWRKEAQIQRKAQLDRLRLEEDFRDRLNDAAAEGDVEAFLRAEREREKALQRQAEDIGEEAQTRAEDFTAESEQRRQDLARRLEDLRNSLAQERAEIRTNFEERRAELLETLEAEKVALKENLAAAYAAIKEQEASLTEDRKKRLQRQQEDERRADAERQRQLQDELRNIGQRRRAILLELAATNNLITAANNLRAASAAAASAASRSSSSTRSGTSRAATRTPRNVPIGFATGGLALATPGGIPARLAENENELVIPVGNAAGTGAAVEALNKLGGMTGSRGYNAGVTVQVNDNRTVMVGDIASVSMVEQALAQYDTALTTQIIRGIEAARYTPSAA